MPLLVSFVARQRGQPSRPIAHVDHMRTTSIPSNYLSVTNHLHINACCGSDALVAALLFDRQHPRTWRNPLLATLVAVLFV